MKGVPECSVASVMSDPAPLWTIESTRLLCLWDFPGKNTGVGCCLLLQGNLLDPIELISLVSPALQVDPSL